MIIEGILTTENDDGAIHISPIGPHVDRILENWQLKPFQTSSTFNNLRRTNRGIFHVIDDPFLMIAGVLGLASNVRKNPDWAASYANDILERTHATFHEKRGWSLENCSRRFSLSVEAWNVRTERAIADCKLQWAEEIRPFWGWNRAKHSLLELAVLTSRRQWIPLEEFNSLVKAHRIIIEKTAGDDELLALALLSDALSQ